MTTKELEQFNEMANVALDAEVRFRLLVSSLKAGNVTQSKVHLELAERVCRRLKNELEMMDGKL